MKRAQRAGTQDAGRRKHRPRTLPKWLQQSDLDAVARSRCLMVLSVLSGEKPVTDAILEAKVSRPTYYQLETKALSAMLAALNPLASASNTGTLELSAATGRITELQERVARLEREKRRTQRLLLLTRKSMRAPLMLGRRRGRPSKGASLNSILSAPSPSRTLKPKASTGAASTPTKAGEGAP